MVIYLPMTVFRQFLILVKIFRDCPDFNDQMNTLFRNVLDLRDQQHLWTVSRLPLSCPETVIRKVILS